MRPTSGWAISCASAALSMSAARRARHDHDRQATLHAFSRTPSGLDGGPRIGRHLVAEEADRSSRRRPRRAAAHGLIAKLGGRLHHRSRVSAERRAPIDVVRAPLSASSARRALRWRPRSSLPDDVAPYAVRRRAFTSPSQALAPPCAPSSPHPRPRCSLQGCFANIIIWISDYNSIEITVDVSAPLTFFSALLSSPQVGYGIRPKPHQSAAFKRRKHMLINRRQALIGSVGGLAGLTIIPAFGQVPPLKKRMPTRSASPRRRAITPGRRRPPA